MTDSNLTHIYFLLDRSGSMHSIQDDTVGGFAAFMAQQRKVGGECRVTLAQFDDVYEVVYRDQPIADVPALTLKPRGATALLDSMGRLITEAGASLAALPEEKRPGTVIVGIMTDGYENASREWTYDAVKALVEQQTKVYSWDFLYLGADQDAIQVGMSLGVSADRSMTYAREATATAMSMASAVVGRIRGARSMGLSADGIGYEDSERSAAAGDPIV